MITAQNVEIEGTIKITQGAQAGYILKSDADGVATWNPQADAERKQIFVTDFGAKGDGTTDDTNAFQTAIDSAATQGSTLHVPAGNYKITQTLNVPAGVQLRGSGLGNSKDANINSTTGSRISFNGTGYALEFSGDYVGCHNLTLIDIGGQAAGGINFSVKNSAFGVGASFNDLFLLNFINGTSLKLEALSGSGIAWSSYENIHIRNAKKGIHIEIEDDGSFINLVTFRSINITGTNFEYGLFVEGPLSTTDWYSVAMQADCPTVGHIVLDTKGAVNIYGIQIESADAGCSNETVLVQLNEDTRGSYIHGNAGKGSIIDSGSNFIDLQGESDTGIRPSGNNLFQNSGFKGLADNALPYWEFKDCTGCTPPDAIEIEAAAFKENHNVLKLTIGAGKKSRLAQIGTYFTDAYENRECLFGAMVKSDAADASVVSAYQSCGGIGFSSSSAHPNDDKWHFIGKPAELDPDNTCQPNPQFSFDNTAGESAAVIYITTPSFVFNRGQKPALDAGPITTAGGIMTGTLTTAMMSVASPATNALQLTADANLFQITGINGINSINQSIAIFPQGTMITLLFESSGLSVAHDDNLIKLLGAVNYVSEIFSTLKLVSLGNGIWQEIDRNCTSGCASTLNRVDKELEETIVLTQPKELELTSTTSVKIYPNPTKYGIHVALNQIDFDKAYRLQLMDTNGRILLIQPLSDLTNWIDFNALNLVAGRYQVQVLTKSEVVHNNGLIIVPH